MLKKVVSRTDLIFPSNPNAPRMKTLNLCIAVAVLAVLSSTVSAGDDCTGLSLPPHCLPKHAAPHSAKTRHAVGDGPVVKEATCETLTFENVPNGEFVAPALESSNFRTTAFVALVDADVGGGGNFANEPSPNTVGFTPITTGLIVNFTQGCGGLSFWFVQATLITGGFNVKYYNMDGTQVLKDVNRLDDGLDQAPGDPTGQYSLWFQESHTASNDNRIGSVVFSGNVGNQVAFDDFKCCVNTDDFVGTCTGTASENCAEASVSSTKVYLPHSPHCNHAVIDAECRACSPQKTVCLKFDDADDCTGTQSTYT